MRFISVGPLPQLLRFTRYNLFFQRYAPRHPDHATHKLLLFRLQASPAASTEPEFFAMEAKCPHLGADLGHAEIEDAIVVCPWHSYTFDLRNDGESDTGMQLCTYAVKLRGGFVLVQSPGKADEDGWELVKYEPVSEAFAELPTPPLESTDEPSGTASLSLDRLSLGSTPSLGSPPGTLSDRPTTLLQYALVILKTANPLRKVALTREALAFVRSPELLNGRPLVDADEGAKSRVAVGHETPPREESKGGSVAPGRTGKRGKGGSEKSRSLMLHALANIEQWAIDLAWDIIARFAALEINGVIIPDEFYLDWVKVAEDEAKHFSLLVALLNKRGVNYGDHPVHAGLWDSARETSHSLRARLAIIHMVHEARGLDVNPHTIEKFRKAGDLEAVEALEIIHSDEVTHVTAGHKWFTWVCKQEGVDPIETFRKDVRANFRGKLKGPFNETDRLSAGMTPDFYEDLEGKGYDSEEELKEAPKHLSSITEEVHPRLT